MQEIIPIGRLIRSANQALAQQMQKSHDRLCITCAQGYVLGYLNRRHNAGSEPVYARDVEQHFHVRHSSVSGLLQRLETKGFVTFREDVDDRRCKQILLTEKAKEAFCRIDEHIRRTEQQILTGMTREEAETFVRLLKKVNENLIGSDAALPPVLELGKEGTPL